MPEPTQAEPTFAQLAVRDGALIATTIGAWWFAVEVSTGRGAAADIVGLLLGLAGGATVYLLHEWGHALGALATGSVVAPARSLRGISLFSFDSKRNDRRQFAVMSLSGFAVTAVAVWFVYNVLPDDALASRVARGATLALASLTLLVEVPLLVTGLVRGKLPPVETFEVEPHTPHAGDPGFEGSEG